MYKGSCLCANISYELSAELGEFGYCHCTSCRKASGTAHAANAPIHRSHFQLHSGGDTLRDYAYLSATPDMLRLRLGSLDTAFTRQPKAHTFVSDKAPWEPIADGLPQFDSWAPKDVLLQLGSRQDLSAAPNPRHGR
jgi:hypothetical protein